MNEKKQRLQPITAWWFARERRLPNGDDRPIAVGQTHTHTGELKLCHSGLHASRNILDALQYAPGTLLCRVQCSGETIEGGDKLACTRRKYLAVVDATAMLHKFARRCALDVIGLWEAPEVVRRYLRTGDEQIRDAAVWYARDAWADAREAARDAAARGAAAWHDRAVACAARAAACAASVASSKSAAACDARDAAYVACAACDAAARDARATQQRRLHRMAMRLIRKAKEERRRSGQSG